MEGSTINKTFWRLYGIAISLIVLGVLLLILFYSNVFAASLEWTRNTEPDMKEYHVYVCRVPLCVASNVGQTWIGTVPQTALGIKPSILLPDNVTGATAITAQDQSGNVSGVSVSFPFSSVLLDNQPPNAPGGLSIKP